jgi:sialate O-acetylesterase
LDNVLVGEVWLGSGQSNMVGGASEYVKKDEVKDEVLAKMVAAGPYPKIRLIRLESGKAVWTEATPDNLREFSALLLSFGIPLQTDLNVPVGLLVGAAGGKPSGFFLSEEAFNSDPACQDLVAKGNPDEAVKKYEEAVKKHEVAMESWKKDVEKAKAEGVDEKKLPKAPAKPLKVGGTFGVAQDFYSEVKEARKPRRNKELTRLDLTQVMEDLNTKFAFACGQCLGIFNECCVTERCKIHGKRLSRIHATLFRENA